MDGSSGRGVGVPSVETGVVASVVVGVASEGAPVVGSSPRSFSGSSVVVPTLGASEPGVGVASLAVTDGVVVGSSLVTVDSVVDSGLSEVTGSNIST